MYGHYVGLIHKTVAMLMFWRDLKQFACIQSQCDRKLGEQQINSVCRPTVIHIAGIVCRFMQQSMYSPTHPAGQPGGLPRGYFGLFCLFNPLGYGVFLKFCTHAGITGFFDIENPSDYSSDCYKIKV